MTDPTYGERWQRVQAPRTGDIRRELTLEAAEYLGLTAAEARKRVEESGADFYREWQRFVTDPSDAAQVVRFYNESRSELFEQIAWHASDVIHHRSPVCAELALSLRGREFLDYGSGIGSNALVFGLAGFDVTLADVADPLRQFARWRCERRGIRVREMDLKQQSIEPNRYDVITCFDVLEHVPDPLAAVRRIRDSLRPGGVLFLYAPFGFDPERPMHVVHRDAVSPRIRSLGFALKHDWERAFPDYVYAPNPYERVVRSPFVNGAYFVRDVWLNGHVGDLMSRALRRIGARARPGPASHRVGLGA